MAAVAQARRSFLCLFAQEHPDFRLQELLSIASVMGCDVQFDPQAYSNKNPLLVVQLPSESCAKQIASRAMTIKSVFELWGWGRNYDELETSIKESFPTDLKERYKATGYTFKLVAGGFSKKCSLTRQKWIFDRLSFLQFGGKVDLNNPLHEFHVLEDYGENPNTASSEPLRVFFGRLVSHGQRHLIKHYSVKNRLFIGNTSMDAQLSLLMANQAKVRPGSLVYDPFAGTGSVLVACAHFGGHVLGSDIDWTLVHGRGCSSRAGSQQKYRGRGESVEANLRQYGLEHRYTDMLVADAASSIWRQQELFDAIVTDPPYGIREGGRKIGSRREIVNPVPDDMREGHIPATCDYKLSEMFTDLVKFAVRYLVVGGRLVYWVPIILNEFNSEVLPTHPCLKLVSSSVQPLQRHVGRMLVTMEKHTAWSRHLSGGTASDEQSQKQTLSLHDNFREKYFSPDHT